MRDVLSALRQLRTSAAFAAIVILTIALGIGANTAIFTLVHAILLRSLPVSDPGTLLSVGDGEDCCFTNGFQEDSGEFSLVSYDMYRRFQADTPEFSQLAAMQASSESMAVRRGARIARSERVEYVSGNYFQTLGIGAFAGRVLSHGDDTAGAAPAIVMSYAAWQSDYGGDPHVVGSAVSLRGKLVTVVGIAPAGFFGDRLASRPPAFWVPLTLEPALNGKNSVLHVPETGWLYLIGRVRPGTAIPALQAKMSVALRAWMRTVPDFSENGGASQIPKQHVVLMPGGSGIRSMQQGIREELYILLSISGMVLLVACANVANLLLARGATRKTEVSVRMALGAARSRLVRQMLTESVLLASLGGLAGLILAYAGTRLILSLAFPESPQLTVSATPSLPVLGFAFLLSLTTGMIFGVLPAWMSSQANPADALRGVSRSTRDRSSLPQRSLIVFQCALSLVLLIGAGLLTRSLGQLEHQDFGLKTENRYVLHLDPAGAGYTPQQLGPLYQQLEQRFGALPGIESVGLAVYTPLEGRNWGEEIFPAGAPAPSPAADIGSSEEHVSPHFFAAVGQKILRGRDFSDSDTPHSQQVAIVNQAFVKKFFPGVDPIGRSFGTYMRKYANAIQIVGVVADAKYVDPREDAHPMYFRPLMQEMAAVTEPNWIMAQTRAQYIDSIVLHFIMPPQDLDALARHILSDINPNLTVLDLRSFDAQVAGNFGQDRLVVRLATLFGLLALALAAVGMYGILSYQVARRTSEIGLRMALGADRAAVIRMVLHEAFLQIAVGLAIGIPASLAAAHFVASQLYGVRSYDPASLLAAIAALSVSAALASFLPARRAASIEPITALRAE